MSPGTEVQKQVKGLLSPEQPSQLVKGHKVCRQPLLEGSGLERGRYSTEHLQPVGKGPQGLWVTFRGVAPD